MAYVARSAQGANGLRLDDPLARHLLTGATQADGAAGKLVDELLGLREVFGDDLREHAALRSLLTEQVGDLLQGPVP
jgi:fructuronate reductase